MVVGWVWAFADLIKVLCDRMVLLREDMLDRGMLIRTVDWA